MLLTDYCLIMHLVGVDLATRCVLKQLVVFLVGVLIIFGYRSIGLIVLLSHLMGFLLLLLMVVSLRFGLISKFLKIFVLPNFSGFFLFTHYFLIQHFSVILNGEFRVFVHGNGNYFVKSCLFRGVYVSFDIRMS